MDSSNGYNKETGGSKNKHMSEEIRIYLSKIKKGKYTGDKNPMYGVHLKVSDEKKRLLSERFSGDKNPMYGVHRKISDEEKRRASERFSGRDNPFFGKKHTEEAKRKMRNNEARNKKVMCIETNVKYGSINEASRETGIIASSIGKCCWGKQHTAGTFHWVFVA